MTVRFWLTWVQGGNHSAIIGDENIPAVAPVLPSTREFSASLHVIAPVPPLPPSFRRMPESMLSEGGAVRVVPLFEMDTGLYPQGGRYFA